MSEPLLLALPAHQARWGGAGPPAWREAERWGGIGEHQLEGVAGAASDVDGDLRLADLGAAHVAAMDGAGERGGAGRSGGRAREVDAPRVDLELARAADVGEQRVGLEAVAAVEDHPALGAVGAGGVDAAQVVVARGERRAPVACRDRREQGGEHGGAGHARVHRRRIMCRGP